MTLRDVQKVLNANVLWGEGLLDQEIRSACGSDMMSDVLAFGSNHSILLTGLVNQQAIRTAEMMDMLCVVFVRGKEPGYPILELAEEKGIVVMNTEYRMFLACGLLYQSGLSEEGF
jgi:predicted transcriptional regulator